MIRLSKRLKAAASLVRPCSVFADVGTDHGYVPIYLVQQGKIQQAVAMDINRGPLLRAKEHIAQYGLEAQIKTRLSDGVAALLPQEAQSILIAGMGGGLVIHILTAGGAVCRSAGELILQPQSELYSVREFLALSGYVTKAEEMVEEDGKYYPMMRVGFDPDAQGGTDLPVCLAYGRNLLEQRHPVLQAYLKRERRIYQKIVLGLDAQRKTEAICRRKQEMNEAIRRNEEAFQFMGVRIDE